ncbi:MAG: GNAT family N-acetyltransferase, partial [Defluviitaleaceae bacterium]|nr:GNAT family N-acetyltransferase [Defluviitaleaceae bacterium]
MKIYKTFPDGMQIVEYDDTLAQLVADMWNKSREGWGGGSDIRTADQVVGEHAGGSFFNVFLALKDGEIIGYCSYDRYYKDGDTAYVHCLNVRPDFHGHKVGKALVLMCVNETIARGMPRVDIHTWPGNTKAVPLYKKCGFLWEDRADTTHLSNYIPTVLETELFKDFFAKADWYADSTRVIEIRPDGVKSDNFEFAGYQWEKDGERLSVGFEKTGRRVRRAETDDYLIEMTADNHELAFGFGYNCKFRVVNKTGKPLDIAITGKSDGVIDFTGQWEAAVAGEAEFTGDFFVNAIPEEQDIWRMHPCVLADVTVNGKHAEFGLGIEPKFPLTVKLTEKRLAAKPGMTEDLYINVKNSLPESGTVRFALPDNALTDFGQKSYEIRLEKGNDAMIETKAVIKACGYEALPVAYEIELDGGRKTGFTRALHLVNQGLEGQFAYENDAEYGAANGQWRLRLNKLNNGVDYERIVPPGHGYFWGYSLGKPFSDEFNITKPSDVRVAIDGAFVKMEADFESQKFSGALLTEIFEMDAAGTLKLSHRVTNRSAQARELFVKANICTNVGRRVVFHYDGQFHEISDELHYGFSDISPEKIDENWMFDYSAGNPAGVYWPAKYKPYTKWGDVFQFEYAAGELAPGESFETEPIVYMLGVFGSFVDFRNFVLGINEEIAPYTHNHLEILTNGGNPVVSGERLTLALVNHRQKVWPGTVSVSSPDGLFAEETQENTEDVIREENSFTVPLAPGKTGIQEARVSVRFQSYEKDNTRAVLIPDRSAQIFSGEKDGVFTVTNGALSFSAAPAYADAAYSLKYGENEWFFSKYPKAAPHSWWNPFVG